MDERIEALEAAIAGEETRYHQQQARFNFGPAPFAGTISESVEDFFAKFDDIWQITQFRSPMHRATYPIF